ncbi:MAG TPA: adenylate/guanylate cyclase domain-containing protein [Acidimicrobiia bacterium]|nr:adenylate/guanylate cyclase domain-containing protein [Acidimicrobiia bacterium]
MASSPSRSDEVFIDDPVVATVRAPWTPYVDRAGSVKVMAVGGDQRLDGTFEDFEEHPEPPVKSAELKATPIHDTLRRILVWYRVLALAWMSALVTATLLSDEGAIEEWVIAAEAVAIGITIASFILSRLRRLDAWWWVLIDGAATAFIIIAPGLADAGNYFYGGMGTSGLLIVVWAYPTVLAGALAIVGLVTAQMISGAIGIRKIEPTDLVGDIAVWVVLGIVYGWALWALRNTDVGRERAEARMVEANERTERLLLNILPAPIVERLKAGVSPIADRIDTVTILFADIVDSTPLAERLDPDDFVDLLDRVFTHFDDLADRCGLEKIGSIGDGYMAVAGAPIPMPDHARVAADLALEMLASLDSFAVNGGKKLQMRFGLHTGPVVAGVIGRRKFRYDLWGDAVNTASRMESHGAPDRIQVSAATRKALGDGYRFEHRGTIEIKGKGEMETYFLVGRA